MVKAMARFFQSSKDRSYSNQAILHPNLIFDNVNISFGDEHKKLGVTFSKYGKWKNHIDNLIKSATKILGTMRSLKVILCASEHICSIVRYCFRSFKQL